MLENHQIYLLIFIYVVFLGLRDGFKRQAIRSVLGITKNDRLWG